MPMTKLSEVEKRANEVFRHHLDKMAYSPESQEKVSRASSDFIRMKLREEGFLRQILPPETITGADLHKQVVTDKPSRIEELEPDSPAAMSIPFGEFPEATYIYGKRWLITFARVATPIMQKDVVELHDYDLDIRQVISDNAHKDLQAEEDGKFIQTVNSILSNDTMTPNQVVERTNRVQWQTMAGGLSRDNLIDAKAVMMATPAKLRPQMALCSQITALQFEKWQREEVGGTMAQDILINGWAGEAKRWSALDWVTTIKNELVPDNSLYLFAPPEFLGKLYFLEDTTMHIKREGPMISWYSYECLGGGIANVAGVTRIDFTEGGG